MSNNQDKKVIGIFYYPWEHTYVKKGDSNRTFFNLYKKMVWYKANPRNKEYMENLFFKKFPDGKFFSINNSADIETIRDEIKSYNKIYLLYPDAIGLGFSLVERKLFREISPQTSVRILNGRGRDFYYSFNAKFSIKLRRFFSRALFGEFIFMFLMLVISLFYLCIDLLRGKK